MKRLKRHRPSPAMVVAMLALMVALSGTAVADEVVTAAKNLITGAQVEDGSLSLQDFDSKARAEIAAAKKKKALRGRRGPRGLRGPAGAAGAQGATGPAGPSAVAALDTSAFLAATGKAVDADKLDGVDSAGFLGAGAKAADADKLDGVDSAGYIKGRGSIGFNRRQQTSTTFPGTFATHLTIPGIGRIETRCGDALGILLPSASARFVNASGGTLDAVIGAVFASLADGGAQDTGFAFGIDVARTVIWQVGRGTGLIGGTDIATIVVTMISHPGGADNCRFQAQAIQQDSPGLTLAPILIPFP